MTNNEFIETKEYKRFVEFCEDCAKYKYVGVCHGRPGVGKSFSARHYCRWDYIQPIITDSYVLEDQGKLVDDDRFLECKALYYTAPVTRPARMEREIDRLAEYLHINKEIYKYRRDGQAYDVYDISVGKHQTFYENVDLVIVDESDRCQFNALEILRDVYDKNDIGLVLMGMPGMEKRLSRYPQLYSRIGFNHEFNKLSSQELKHLLEFKWNELSIPLSYEKFEDYEAIHRVLKITNGNFRLVHRLFSQIQRIVDINNLETITSEVVDTARETLIIGTNE